MQTLNCNFHIHSQRSACAGAEMTLVNILRESDRLGYQRIGICDHAHRKRDGMAEHLRLARSTVKRLGSKVEVLLGCEAEMHSPADISISRATAKECDYVLVAANHYHLSWVENPRLKSARAYARHYLKMFEGAIDSGLCHVVAHPFVIWRIQGVETEEIFRCYRDGDLRFLLKKAAKRDVALELNPRHALQFSGFFRRLLEICRSAGCQFVVGSDAHALQAIRLPISCQQLSRLGFRNDDFIVPAKCRQSGGAVPAQA
ncbi:MAG: PHP domain-containing protein [Verrucomicrobiae bacterium]|nr:PHP domain-containing protein [Verrucomicrobiae bacterium]